MKAVMLCFPFVAVCVALNSVHMKYTPKEVKVIVVEKEEIKENNL